MRTNCSDIPVFWNESSDLLKQMGPPFSQTGTHSDSEQDGLEWEFDFDGVSKARARRAVSTFQGQGWESIWMLTLGGRKTGWDSKMWPIDRIRCDIFSHVVYDSMDMNRTLLSWLFKWVTHSFLCFIVFWVWVLKNPTNRQATALATYWMKRAAPKEASRSPVVEKLGGSRYHLMMECGGA
jgi:hypothetical protein